MERRKGCSDAAYRLYEDVVAPAVGQALAILVKEQVAKARDVELKRLYRAATTAEKSSLGDARALAEPSEGPHIEPKTPSDTERADIADRAAKRQMVVNPILEKKRWRRGRLVTESGLGKATVYGYLDGTRSWITPENRRAMADALGIETETLPE
jgi:hypothetical protein